MCKTVEVASAQVCQRPEKQRNTNTPSVPNSKLWTIHGKRYYLRPYVRKHPGGEHAILLGQGIDCTTLFETYHPFTERPHKVLKVYKYDDCPEPDVVDNVFDWTNKLPPAPTFRLVVTKPMRKCSEIPKHPGLHGSAMGWDSLYWCGVFVSG
jgi:cytochrome b involved in lipid metabolism